VLVNKLRKLDRAGLELYVGQHRPVNLSRFCTKTETEFPGRTAFEPRAEDRKLHFFGGDMSTTGGW
jgi:hypothetical protein